MSSTLGLKEAKDLVERACVTRPGSGELNKINTIKTMRNVYDDAYREGYRAGCSDLNGEDTKATIDDLNGQIAAYRSVISEMIRVSSAAHEYFKNLKKTDDEDNKDEDE